LSGSGGEPPLLTWATDREEDVAVGFQADVKPMFRESDRDAMLWALDLWSYDDVALHAADILARIEDGSMPCDMAWEVEQTLKFRAWIDGGCLP
jgi:hypothetical protein